jgi:hypothetical protein
MMMNATRGMVLVTAAAVALMAGTAGATTVGSQFDPADYTSLGSLTPTTSVDFFTGDGVSAPTVTIDGGGAIAGTTATSQSGNVELAIFTFDAVNVGSGVTVGVTGNRGLVIASQGNLTFSSTLSLNGGATGYGTTTGGAGGPGGEGGVPATSYDSGAAAASQDDRGDGGDATPGALDGIGYGGGDVCDTWSSSNPKIQVKGVGASYGGLGGTPPETDPGETTGTTATYGDEEMTDLYGGSGGSSSNKQRSGRAGSGGGGALELTAAGTLTVDGTLEAKGGKTRQRGKNFGGGGGSGGGILLTAPEIVFSGLVDVSGGPTEHRDDDPRSGGAGGGGRVAFYTDSLIGISGEPLDALSPLDTWPLNGGGEVIIAGGTSEGDYPGSEGTYFVGEYNLGEPTVVIPEPASALAVMLGAGAVGGYLRRRRRGSMPAAGMLLVAAAAVALMAGTAPAASWNFDDTDQDTLAELTGAGWTLVDGNEGESTDDGVWTVADATSKGDNSLNQTNADMVNPSDKGIGGYALEPGSYGPLALDAQFYITDDDNNDSADIVWAWQDNDNYYYAQFRPRQDGRLDLHSMIGGTRGNLGTVTDAGVESQTWHDLVLTHDPVTGMLTIGLDGSEIYNGVADAGLTFSGGRVGFGSYNDAASFDNITAAEPAAVIPEPVSALAVLLGAGALGGYLRRRRR